MHVLGEQAVPVAAREEAVKSARASSRRPTLASASTSQNEHTRNAFDGAPKSSCST